jgi:hypothetical protein
VVVAPPMDKVGVNPRGEADPNAAADPRGEADPNAAADPRGGVAIVLQPPKAFRGSRSLDQSANYPARFPDWPPQSPQPSSRTFPPNPIKYRPVESYDKSYLNLPFFNTSPSFRTLYEKRLRPARPKALFPDMTSAYFITYQTVKDICPFYQVRKYVEPVQVASSSKLVIRLVMFL